MYIFETIDLYIFTWKNLGYSNRHGKPNIHPNCNDIIKISDILEYYKKYDFINIKHILIEDFDNFINELNPDLLKIYIALENLDLNYYQSHILRKNTLYL